MRKQYVKSIEAKCSLCECDLINGGYIYFERDNSVAKVICKPCDQFKAVTQTRPKKIVLRKYYGFLDIFFGSTTYEVISTTNAFISSATLSEKEVQKLLTRPDVEVIIKH